MSPPRSRNSSVPSAAKAMLMLFWDFNGHMVNIARYYAILEGEVKPTIHSKRTGMLRNGGVLHHNNARPHLAAAYVETIRKLKFGLLPHPEYSPKLPPPVYHIIRPLKDALRGRRFENDEEVEDEVHTWLRAKPKTLFADGIRKLVDGNNKCVKITSKNISIYVLVYLFYNKLPLYFEFSYLYTILTPHYFIAYLRVHRYSYLKSKSDAN
jgi:hypothetical protein